MSQNSSQSDRTCLIILGMHRSGTSALTRVMSLMGAALPKHVLGAGPANKTGHWEPERLVALHDQMLAEFGASWDDFRKFRLEDISPTRAQQFKAAIAHVVGQEFGDAPVIVLKDPRICRFAPLYAEIMAEMGYGAKFIHMIRNPLSVGASLAKRDGLPEAFSWLIWLRYVLDAEATTRGRDRAFASYEAMMEDWRPSIAAISDRLGLGWTADESAQAKIDAYLSREQTHHETDAAALLENESASQWLREAYRLMLKLKDSAEDPETLGALDAVRENFDHASLHMGEPVIAMMKDYLAKFAAMNETLRGTIASLNAHIKFSDKYRANAG